jgi:hypothetical protein
MTTATLRLPTSIADAPTAPKKGLLARFYAALIEARMRHAMQEIARYRHLVPDDIVKNTGYEATLTNDGALPFTR